MEASDHGIWNLLILVISFHSIHLFVQMSRILEHMTRGRRVPCAYE